MKTIFIISMLICNAVCFGQEIATRTVSVGKDSFLIKYEYSLIGYMEPLVYRALFDSTSGLWHEDTAAYRRERHYSSDISVYKIFKYNYELIGEHFWGYYTLDGCYEDQPKHFVAKAKYLQSIIDSNIVLRNKNGINAQYKYIVTYVNYETGLDSGGLTIKKLDRKKVFKTNKEAHDFIDRQISFIGGGGVDFKMDSLLIKKQK